MEIIVKPQNIYKLNKMASNAFLFGLKNFSINATSIIDVNALTHLQKKLKNKKIFISIDKNIFDKDIPKLKKALLNLDKLSIQGILFYDIALLKLKEELKLKTPLIWNQNFLVTNYKTINYYTTFGVNGALLASEITQEEIKQIKKETKIDLYINGFGYQLMGFSKRHLVTNYFRYIKQKKISNNHYLKDDSHKYKITEEKEGTAFLSSYILNTIKEVNTFKTIGIKYIILDEKGIKKKDFLYVLDLFNGAINKKVNQDKLNGYEEKIKKLIPNTDTGFLNKKTIYKVK